MNNDFNQEIVDHAILNVENLSLAIKIHNAYEEIKKRLIKNFTQSLLVSLQEKLPEEEWEINIQTLIDKPAAASSGLFINRRNWPKGLEVGIEAGLDNARLFSFVVFGKESESLSKDQINEIKVQINNKIGSELITTNQEVIWQRHVRADLKNWDNEVALLKLKNGEALGYFTNELISIVNVVDAILIKS